MTGLDIMAGQFYSFIIAAINACAVFHIMRCRYPVLRYYKWIIPLPV